MARGELTALSDRRWQYKTQGKTRYISKRHDGRWYCDDEQIAGPDDMVELVDAMRLVDEQANPVIRGGNVNPGRFLTAPAGMAIPAGAFVVQCPKCGTGYTGRTCPGCPSAAKAKGAAP